MDETLTILRVKTEGVESISDLKDNVKQLKGYLDGATIGTEEYKEALDLLKINQNALKDAMYATTGTLKDLTSAATGSSESYNSLVHRMAALKEEFRATNDEVRRANLGGQINEINQKLKDLDALQGNFQRNVGNYAGSIKDAFGDMSKNVDVFRKSLGSVGGGLNGLKDGMEGISKSPFVATFGILVSLALKMADELKENETAMAAIKKGMDALKPVMDFLSGILENVATFLADIITKVVQFVTSNGLFNKIIKGVMGVGNAILKYVTAPFKGVIEAIKVFKEQGIKGLGNAAKAFGQEMKQGFSFKENFKAGQVAADTILEGAASRKKKAKETGKAIGKEVGKGVIEGLIKELDGILDAIDKAWDKKLQDRQALHEKRQKEITDYNKESMAKFLEEQEEEADAAADAWLESYHKQEEAAKKTAEARKELMKSVASSTSDILGTIADLYEMDEENAEKNANKIKALRIAAATVDTISGAIGAFMQASETIPPPYGQIVGAIEAAAITATGIANIAKIKATNVSTDGGSQRPSLTTAPAPTLQTRVSNVRTLTSASEEERLNQMASDQRVYILASDIQASQNQIKTQVSESSF